MAPQWRPRHTMYLAACLSAWGDRMWTFAVGLYMVYATPDSLRLTAIYGLVISVSVIALGATVGRWVDTTARLRVVSSSPFSDGHLHVPPIAAQLSLLVQNSAVCSCAIILMVGLQYADYTASTWHGWLHILLQVLVIVIADVAALATVANKITIEKDWVVVMAQGDKDTLAWMNSAFRTIDLGTYILAPVLVGQLMTFLSPVAAAAFMAGWNVVSLGIEYFLLRRVYNTVPQLARPKAPDAEPHTPELQELKKTELQDLKQTMPQELRQTELQPLDGVVIRSGDGPPGLTEVVNGATETGTPGEAPLGTEEDVPPGKDDVTGSAGAGPDASAVPVGPPPPPAGCCRWLGLRLADMRRGWTVYFRSSFCLAGLALASLYMTVLGFDNITAGYGYTQGLTESTLSLLTGAGAFTGICGSLCFPRLRHYLGPTRAGVVGFSLAVLAQSLSLVSVFLPGTAFWPLADPDGAQSRASVFALFSGIILARFGLWVSDLSVTQLLQERVPESRRGAISGVQSSLNMTMDTAKCLLVICVPRASHFGILIILSYLFWVIGWCFFAAYAWTAGRQPVQTPEDGYLADGDRTAGSGDVTARSGDVMTQSGDISARSDDVTVRPADVMAQSDDVTAHSADVAPTAGLPGQGTPPEGRPLLASDVAL